MIDLTNYSFFGNPTPNSARFVHVDDAVMHRQDLTVSRKASSYNTATKVASIPEYRVVIRKDARTGDPLEPNGQRLSVDLVIRSPIQPEPADLQNAVSELKGLLAQEGFLDAVQRQMFPCALCETK